MASRMSTKQVHAYQEAIKAGDKEKAERIYKMGYVADYKDFDMDVEVVSQETELDEDEVLSDIGAGMEDSEIREKYGISAQKLGAIKRKAK